MMLSREEMFERNLELTKQRLLKEIETPEAFDWIPQDARIITLPKDAPELVAANLELAVKLVGERDDRPIVLILEPGSDIPWQVFGALVAGKRIVTIESIQGGIGGEVVFDDGSRFMVFATQQPDVRGKEHPVFSVGMRKGAGAEAVR
jgi:hypothetical protein